ncbi:unnamed protein product [Musa hybrid cultivar]
MEEDVPGYHERYMEFPRSRIVKEALRPNDELRKCDKKEMHLSIRNYDSEFPQTSCEQERSNRWERRHSGEYAKPEPLLHLYQKITTKKAWWWNARNVGSRHQRPPENAGRPYSPPLPT